jgi:hypothetical protein
MTRPNRFKSWVLFASFFFLSWASIAGATDEAIATSQLQEDFCIMRSALEQAHGAIYRYTPKIELDRRFDDVFRRIDRPMTALEFWQLVAPVVAEIKCGHTSVWWPKETQTQLLTGTPLIPLNVRAINNRLYVRRDYSNPEHDLEGAEIISINNVSGKVILKKMMQVLTGDGNSKTAKPYRLGHYGNFNVLLFAALKIESPFRITYRKHGVARRTIEIPGILVSEMGKAAASRDPEPNNNAEMKMLDDGKIAVLTIRAWYRYVDTQTKITFAEFLQKSFEQMYAKGTQSLILDVRDNAGGIDELGKELFSYLSDKPFEYYADLVINAREFDFFKHAPGAKPVPADLVELRSDGKFHFVKHPNWGIQQPQAPFFPGKIFVLMNGGSFSTTCEFLSVLHFHKRAVFIGEETAGNYYQNTSGMFNADLVLPNSKLQMTVPLSTYYAAVAGYRHKDRGILPDYPVTYAASEVITRTDKEMSLALHLARK